MGIHPRNRNVKSPSWKEDGRKREEEGRSVSLHLREFKANGNWNNPGQRKMLTIPVVPLPGGGKVGGVYLSRWQCQVTGRWRVVYPPSISRVLRWGGAEDEGRTYVAPRNAKKNANGNNRVIWRGFRDRSFHSWTDSLAAWNDILLLRSNMSSKLFRLFLEPIRHWQFLALTELR